MIDVIDGQLGLNIKSLNDEEMDALCEVFGDSTDAALEKQDGLEKSLNLMFNDVANKLELERGERK